MNLVELKTLTEEPSAALLGRARQALSDLWQRQEGGFLRVLERPHLWQSSQQRAEELASRFKHMIVLGMGGSHLGAQVLQDALPNGAASSKVIYLGNIDSRFFWEQIERYGAAADSHFVIVSKSGSTLETLAMANFVQQFLHQHGRDLAAQSTIISDRADNPLTRWAQQHQVVQLEIPQDVGGRFSVLTPVGLLPAAFDGLDLTDLQRGVAWALDQRELCTALIAQCLTNFAMEKWITLFWCYSERLRHFGFWLQQLWAESLGKKVNRQGRLAPRVSTPFVCVGASDQHSILQQVSEGAADKFIWFFRDEQAESGGPTLKSNLFAGHDFLSGKSLGEVMAAEATATQQTLADKRIPSLTLSVPAVNAEVLGALFMLFEMVIAGVGESLGINTFDQPGVEAGKQIARQIIRN